MRYGRAVGVADGGGGERLTPAAADLADGQLDHNVRVLLVGACGSARVVGMVSNWQRA